MQDIPTPNIDSHFCSRRRGYITSTPKSADFREKSQKRAKNERASCMPRRFFAERPYLAPPKHEFSGPILGLKSHVPGGW